MSDNKGLPDFSAGQCCRVEAKEIAGYG